MTGGGLHPQVVPYDLLTDKEKRKERERCQELLKYLQFMGYKLHRSLKIPKKPKNLYKLQTITS